MRLKYLAPKPPANKSYIHGKNRVFIGLLKYFAPCLLVLLFAGCHHLGSADSRFQFHYDSYSEAVDKRVQTAKLYLKLETIMIVHGVVMDDGLKTAWVDEQARAGHLDSAERETLLTKELDTDKGLIQFILAVYTSEREWNDLDVKDDSRWRVFLAPNGGEPLRPVSIDKIKLAESRLRDHIPFDARFKTFYTVSFPKDKAGDRPYRLTLSSPLGQVELTWAR